MWGIIIGVFIALNVVSTIIILCACVVSGRRDKPVRDLDRVKINEQMELAVAIAKLRQIELSTAPA